MVFAIVIGCLVVLAVAEGVFVLSDKLPWKKVKKKE